MTSTGTGDRLTSFAPVDPRSPWKEPCPCDPMMITSAPSFCCQGHEVVFNVVAFPDD